MLCRTVRRIIVGAGAVKVSEQYRRGGASFRDCIGRTVSFHLIKCVLLPALSELKGGRRTDL